jgi:hypothetical protein
MQKGFSPLIVVAILAIIGLGVGGAWWFAQQAPSSDSTASEDTATTSVATADKKEKSSTSGRIAAKSKVKACDILPLSKVSSILGKEMEYVPGSSDETNNIDSGDVWNSVCSFIDSEATVESSAGVMFMITEGISDEAASFLREEFRNTRDSENGISVSGFGDEAYKVLDTGIVGANIYYVMKGNKMITAHSAIGHGAMVGERPEYTGTEKTDAETEAILRYVLPQL